MGLGHCWLVLVLQGVVKIAVAVSQCPLVPIMPDSFDFRREMTTFWATETVWTETGSGQTFFSKIEQRPSFIGKGQALLFMPGLDVVGSSSHSICLPWNYCNFEVFDCHGNVVYRGEVTTMTSVADPASQVTALKLTDKDGNYLGRTTELPSLLPRLGGINAKSQSQLTLLDTGDAVVMDLTKDPNQIWVTHWTGQLDAPGMSGFDGVHSVPLADPLLITFLISNQFRNKGLFSPLTDFLFTALFAGLLVYFFWKWRSGACSKDSDDEFDLRNIDPRELKEIFGDGYPLLEGGCCSGNRPKY